ncbi:MAG TPA: hypothetical protein VM537_24315, partial [Anaerolineae bacterium]|nr:hypothetical protein [Anaerolineae bacterium]
MAGSGFIRGTSVNVSLATGDIELGAVELKDATTDTRAKVAASGSIATGDGVIGVTDPEVVAALSAVSGTDSLAMAGDDYSTIVELAGHNIIEFKLLETGGPGSHVGVLQILSSVDGVTYAPEMLTDLRTGAQSTDIAVANGVAVDEVVGVETAAKYIRVFWDRTGGTGTLGVAWCARKGLGNSDPLGLLQTGPLTAAGSVSITMASDQIGQQPAASSISVTPDSGGANWAASGLAKESGVNLATVAARIPLLGPQTAAASMSVTPDSGNAGWAATGLAKEAGGNLAATSTVLGATDDASIDADAAGTIKGALRGLAKAFFARIPAIGPQAAAASMSVTPAIDEATAYAAITVAQTTPAAIMATTAAPRGIRVWSPDGSGGSVANTDYIAIGYTGLTLANAVHWLSPGDEALIP